MFYDQTRQQELEKIGTHCGLFVLSFHVKVDCSPDKVEDEFHRKLYNLPQKVKRPGALIVAGSFNAHIGKLKQTERDLNEFCCDAA